MGRVMDGAIDTARVSSGRRRGTVLRALLAVAFFAGLASYEATAYPTLVMGGGRCNYKSVSGSAGVKLLGGIFDISQLLGTASTITVARSRNGLVIRDPSFQGIYTETVIGE